MGVAERAGVVVAGSLHVDLIASAHRLPVRGESLPGHAFTTQPGGKAGNQAAAVAAQGVPCAMVGRVGRDAFGKLLVESLRRNGVDVAAVERDAEVPTGASTVLTGEDGDYASIVVPSASALLDDRQIERGGEALRTAGWALTQLELGGAIADSFLRAAKRLGCRTMLNAAPVPDDPGSLPPHLWDVVDVVVVNRVEAGMLLGERADVAAASDTDAERLARQLGVRCAVVTLGAGGIRAWHEGRDTVLPAWPVVAVDTVGAGDAFVGVLAAELARANDWDRALRRANAAGALAVTRRGGARPPTVDDIDKLLAGR